jgi:hypothetical protein
MKRITISKLIKELKTIGVNPASQELILNNVYMYNDLIQAYQRGEVKNMYLTYQLNAQIDKQLKEQIKLCKKIESNVQVSPLRKMLQELKADAESED